MIKPGDPIDFVKSYCNQTVQWERGEFQGFGLDYENQESGNGIACGQVTRAIVLTVGGELKLIPFDQVRAWQQ